MEALSERLVMEAEAELLRKNVEHSLMSSFAWCGPSHGDRTFTNGTHLLRLAHALERVERGDCKRLIVTMPPQHGKSELATVQFPAWFLGRRPKANVVVTGYGHDIALKHSKHCRRIFHSDQFRSVFPDAVPDFHDSSVSSNLEEWETRQGGSYYAVGVGGGLTGRSVTLGIIDDPLKNRQDAESYTKRQAVIDWYRSVFYTRHPEAIVLIMTRWHRNDLVGFVLKEQKHEGWEVIKLPAIDETTEPPTPLWPEVFGGLDEYRTIQKSEGRHEWSALYQQNPIVRGGNRFNVDGIKVHETTEGWPEGPWVRCWDLASSSKERNKNDPDFTVGGLIHARKVDKLWRLWVKHMVIKKAEAPERDRVICNTAKTDGSSVQIHMEAYGGYKDAYTTMKAILHGSRVVHRSKLPGDKTTKCAPLEPIFEAGNIHMLKAPWNDEAIRQLEGFPFADHDDVPDVLAIGYHVFAKARGGMIVEDF